MWDKQLVDFLLLNYRNHVNLYDARDVRYTDKNARAESLAEICREVNKIDKNLTMDEVKKKIHNLRSQYLREVRNSLAAYDCGKKYVPKLWCFEAMHEFLRNHCGTKNSDSYSYEDITRIVKGPASKKTKFKIETLSDDSISDRDDEDDINSKTVKARWTHNATTKLLDGIVDELNVDPSCFEQPIPKVFYRRIAELIPQLAAFEWHQMRHKVQQLKSGYDYCNEWMQTEGAKLLRQNKLIVIRNHFSRNCPYYPQLDMIFDVNSKDNEELSQFYDDLENYIRIKFANIKQETAKDHMLDDYNIYYADEEALETDDYSQTIADERTNVSHSDSYNRTTSTNYEEVAHTDAGYDPLTSAQERFSKDIAHTSLQQDNAAEFSCNNEQLIALQSQRLAFEQMKWQQHYELEKERLAFEQLKWKQQYELEKERLSIEKIKLKSFNSYD